MYFFATCNAGHTPFNYILPVSSLPVKLSGGLILFHGNGDKRLNFLGDGTTQEDDVSKQG